MINMSKYLLIALSSLWMANVQANEGLCSYKDYFHLSSDTHPGIYIVSGFTDQDLVLQIVGPRSFVIRDAYQCRAGYAHVTVAYDNANWCVLDITDSPYMNHPTVASSCNGLRYMGTEYDGIGSYSYTIHVD